MPLNRDLSPNFQEIHTVSIPAIQKTVCSNGVPIYFLRAGSQPVCRLEIVFDAGTWNEPLAGIAYFTTKMLSEGTITKSATELHEFFDGYGASFELQHGSDHSAVVVHCLSRHLALLLPVLNDVITQSVLPLAELDILKNTTKQNLEVNLQKTAYIASQQFKAQLFGTLHPYGKSIEFQDIDVISIEQLKDFYISRIATAPFQLFLTGQFSDQDLQVLENNLGNIAFGNNSPCRSLHTPIPANEQLLFIEKAEALQSSIRMGRTIIDRQHPDYTKLLVMNEIFGGYFGSRLMKNIREDKGYTYGISANIVCLAQHAYWVIGTDVKREFTEQTIDEIQKEMLVLQSEEVSKSELETVINFMAGEFVGSLNTPFEVMDRHKVILNHHLPANYYETHINRLRNVTTQDIMQVAQQYLCPEVFYKAIVGGK